MSAGYYRKLSADVYQCLVCNIPYSGGTARHMAKNCCRDKKPITEIALREAANILNHFVDQTDPDAPFNAPHTPPKRAPRRSSHEVNHNPTFGNFSRSKQPDVIIEAALIKAEHDRQRAAFDAIMSDAFDFTEYTERSPLQKLAFAFHLHSWTAVKGAALELARQAVTDYIKRQAFTAIPDHTITPATSNTPPDLAHSAPLSDLLADIDAMIAELGGSDV